jgi:protein-tyrosine-phosphatase
MAVAIARKRLGRRFRVESAGLDGALGCGATRFARKAMQELGLDISRHWARDISSLEITFDYIVAMTPYVAERLKEIAILNHATLIVWDVADPYGTGLENYRICAKTIARLLDDLIGYICQRDR